MGQLGSALGEWVVETEWHCRKLQFTARPKWLIMAEQTTPVMSSFLRQHLSQNCLAVVWLIAWLHRMSCMALQGNLARTAGS